MKNRRSRCSPHLALLVLCAAVMGCDQDDTVCNSNSDCGGSELCVEELCRRVCNLSADCLADHFCSEGICWPEGSRPRADAGPVDTLRHDAHAPDSASPDNAASDGAASDTLEQDGATQDSGSADADSADAGDVMRCPSVTHGGALCQRGCPHELLLRSPGHDEMLRQGYWLCGQQSFIQPTPLVSAPGGADLTVMPRPGATPTDRRALVGNSYVVR